MIQAPTAREKLDEVLYGSSVFGLRSSEIDHRYFNDWSAISETPTSEFRLLTPNFPSPASRVPSLDPCRSLTKGSKVTVSQILVNRVGGERAITVSPEHPSEV